MGSKTRINWTEEGVESLEARAAYIARDSIKYALIFYDKVLDLADELESFPRRWRKVPELNRDDIREIIYGDYRIIYWIKSETQIDVITIHHGAQKFPFKLFEE